MGSISTQSARAELTKALMEVYKERAKTTAFLQSFFTRKAFGTKHISIEVQRGSERVAVDVERGTEGNRNTFSRSTEKIFEPPYYEEYTDVTQLSTYDRLFGSTDISVNVFSMFLQELADSIGMLEDKIERAYELQCAQVLTDGIVQLNAGINIDFKRKAASLLDLGTIAANRYWTVANDATAKVMDDIEAAGTFMRQNAFWDGTVMNLIFGSSTILNEFLEMPQVKERADIRNFSLDMINAPQRNSVGAALHGEVSAGSYKARLWTYPQYYQDSSGTSTAYLDSTKIIFLPESPRFSLSFAAVPQLLTEGQSLMTGQFIYTDFPDPRKKAHDYVVESAGVAIPVAVDQIYTLKVQA